MPTPSIPIDECWRRYRAYLENGREYKAAGAALGITDKPIRRAIEQLVDNGLISSADLKKTGSTKASAEPQPEQTPAEVQQMLL